MDRIVVINLILFFHRKLVTFGMLHHIIRCINKYPVCISDTPINRQRFYTGVHHIDEICCKTDLTPNKIQEDIERDPFVVTICKWITFIWMLFEDFIWLIRSGCNLIVIISYSNLRSIYLLVIFFTRKKKQFSENETKVLSAGFALNFIEFLIYIKKMDVNTFGWRIYTI